jgi:hypothetical protein
MNDSKKWKSRFLSSSIPLEYEVAKILTDLDFSVSFDYTYFRNDGTSKKEFSADIKAHTYLPIDAQNDLNGEITILAECKYRDEGKKWLFLPDTNNPEYSSVLDGNGIKSIAEFSNRKTSRDLIYNFEEELEYALKGVEINISSGEVFDKDIRHGISQLKFGLPFLIKDGIESSLIGNEADSYPQYYISFLITNADLHILNKDLSIQKIKEIENIEEISKKVPYLIYYSDNGPDFSEHHKDIFKDIFKYENSKNLIRYDDFQKSLIDNEYNYYNSPKRTFQSFQHSFPSTLRQYYSNHFICSFDYFPELLSKTIEILTEVTKKKGGH